MTGIATTHCYLLHLKINYSLNIFYNHLEKTVIVFIKLYIHDNMASIHIY